ncbi:unnamed protein product, partial [Heterosigma akashiwo]
LRGGGARRGRPARARGGRAPRRLLRGGVRGRGLGPAARGRGGEGLAGGGRPRGHRGPRRSPRGWGGGPGAAVGPRGGQQALRGHRHERAELARAHAPGLLAGAPAAGPRPGPDLQALPGGPGRVRAGQEVAGPAGRGAASGGGADQPRAPGAEAVHRRPLERRQVRALPGLRVDPAAADGAGRRGPPHRRGGHRVHGVAARRGDHPDAPLRGEVRPSAACRRGPGGRLAGGLCHQRNRLAERAAAGIGGADCPGGAVGGRDPGRGGRFAG